jgi:CheY-like chemotaxis protein
MNQESMPILLVEDDYNDVLLIQRAFRKVEIEPPLAIVSDGDEAIAYFTRQGKYTDTETYPTPLMILLDLKLPRRSGLEVLAWIRQHPQFKRLLVVVLTSSQEHSDIAQAYDLGANSYLVKPINFNDFVTLIKLINAYWFQVNQKPQLLNNMS